MNFYQSLRLKYICTKLKIKLEMEEITLKFKLTAFAGLLSSFGLIYLYVKEFPVFSNTIGVKSLIIGSFIVAAICATLLLFLLRKKLNPWQEHWMQIVFLVFPMLFFSPLIGSWLNRSSGQNKGESFEFVSESPYIAEAYGVIKNQKLKPAGYMLIAKQQGKTYQFRYKSQAYYPLSKPGDDIVVPIKTGLFGVKMVDLR
jgi:hypothetical protein